jgi:hypothetical protein
VDLLILLVTKIDARAERKAEKELVAELGRVARKEGILFRIAEAAVTSPDDTGRAGIYPVAGEARPKQLAAEARANKTAFNSKVRTVLRSSYSHQYRRLLPDLPAALEFRSNNTRWRPIIEALDLLQQYKDIDVRSQSHSTRADRVSLDGVVPRDWREAVVDHRGRVERIPYELCVLNWNSGTPTFTTAKTATSPARTRVGQDLHALALHEPQTALVHVNTAQLQVILAEPEWRPG